MDEQRERLEQLDNVAPQAGSTREAPKAASGAFEQVHLLTDKTGLPGADTRSTALQRPCRSSAGSASQSARTRRATR